MCTYSASADQWRERIDPFILPTIPGQTDQVFRFGPDVDEDEIQQLREEVAEMREALRAAKIYDEENGEPDCENDEKVEWLKMALDLLGFTPEEVIEALALD